MNARCRRFLFLAAAVSIAPGLALGQTAAGLKAVGEQIKVDFREDSPERKIVFVDDGLAMEMSYLFLMVRRDKVRIQADLPEPGQVKIEQLNSAAQVECKTVSTTDRQVVAELVAKLRAMSPEEVRDRVNGTVGEVWGPAEKTIQPKADALGKKELRKYLEEKGIPLPRPAKREDEEKELRAAYVRTRVVETIAPHVLDKLNELAERQPQWVLASDLAAYKRLSAQALLDTWRELLACEVMEDYLKRCGFPTETNRASFRTRLATRAGALYHTLSGKTIAGRAETIAKAFTSAEQERLRTALTVELRCRFYAQVDPQDPNGQWFQGQRVGCKARGVASIRLQGRLDPSGHDRVDWWTLEGYDPQLVHIQYDKNAGFRVDPPFLGDRAARLRIVATGSGPVDYAVEFRPAKAVPEGLSVVVYETKNLVERKFPY